jgi:hypothetical protein
MTRGVRGGGGKRRLVLRVGLGGRIRVRAGTALIFPWALGSGACFGAVLLEAMRGATLARGGTRRLAAFRADAGFGRALVLRGARTAARGRRRVAGGALPLAFLFGFVFGFGATTERLAAFRARFTLGAAWRRPGVEAREMAFFKGFFGFLGIPISRTLAHD